MADPKSVRVAAVDLNGQLRGKSLSSSAAAKISAGVRMPLSALNVDITGADIEGSPLVFETGDQDGVMRPTERGPVPTPWLKAASELWLMSMYHDSGEPFAGDPRHVLASILDRFSARGWRVLAAIELEFYLCRVVGTEIFPPMRPAGGRAVTGPETLSLDELDAFDSFFADLFAAAEDMQIDVQGAISEAGEGQFEINLNHTDAIRAADDAVLAKHLIKGLARSHGLSATFMAKPYTAQSGNGAHVHFSVMDHSGNNVFDDGSERGSDALQHAVAGCLRLLPESTALLFPHPSSFRRLTDGAHAPTNIAWGYENRTTAIRIPGGPAVARRIEHRVAGGDTCPYLKMAAILGGAEHGISNALTPPAPLPGNAYDSDLPTIPSSFADALNALENGKVIGQVFSPEVIANFLMTKRQEQRICASLSDDEQRLLYLERV